MLRVGAIVGIIVGAIVGIIVDAIVGILVRDFVFLWVGDLGAFVWCRVFRCRAENGER